MTDATAGEHTGTAAPRTAAWTVVRAPIGPLLIAATHEGLVNVVFHADARATDRALDRLRDVLGQPPVRAEGTPGGTLTADAAFAAEPALTEAAAQLTAYFRGGLRHFDVALDWSLTGGFHERVLRTLHTTVPFGTTVGYQTLADRVGEPGAARAVGAAMGANPLPVVVPCHRVVASDGGIGGFGGGTETKRELLALEGLLPEPLF
ncbi:methylated-DNA--[protein]-cysteine S-methyltransferase [Streptomyces sp. HNM0574]|uniref:methylated-DNA--[protein]-cysteine S-methyltransferase n=1 Tax=Streptomyces sp. HNM0574 TaxID=2714954 RepID=UPI00146A60DA|nr:methylated-DNA--[protein]-cysteine S-methyltransferase [Streptomyces sp. HNM0574]NLU67523.1 methylated-DNA--[protein]-cysteine S-methyltransferase [Streptomyces sp. HNM0574]